MTPDAYLIECETYCNTCAAAAIRFDAEQLTDSDKRARRLVAAFRLAATEYSGVDLEIVARTLRDRDRGALALLGEMSTPLGDYCASQVPGGERCAQCCVELEPFYISCVSCSRDGYFGDERDDLSSVDPCGQLIGSVALDEQNDPSSCLHVVCGECCSLSYDPEGEGEGVAFARVADALASRFVFVWDSEAVAAVIAERAASMARTGEVVSWLEFLDARSTRLVAASMASLF